MHLKTSHEIIEDQTTVKTYLKVNYGTFQCRRIIYVNLVTFYC